METIDTRLGGRDANLDAIKRFIHRKLGRGPVTRVELRYSSQSTPALDPQLAKQVICNLLRENGMGSAAVSVRMHEGLIDNASGEHVVRLFPAQAQAQAPANGHAGLVGLRWMSRWFPKLVGSGGASHAAPRAEPTHKREQLSSAQAVLHLRRAVQAGARFVETEDGEVISANAGAPAVASALVIVRLAALDDVLKPLIRGDAARAAQSIGAMVRDAGLHTQAGFSVGYAYQARSPGDGSVYATEADVEVVLRRNAQGSNPACAPVATAMPPAAVQRLAQAEVSVLTLRMTGTTDGPFAAPIELRYGALPVRFDRDLLAKSEFGRQHPQLLQVASNSCPLTVQRAADGGFVLQAESRTLPGGASMAMYFRADNQDALGRETRVSGGTLKLLVNAPHGVVDCNTGKNLPALCMELALSHATTLATAMPLAA